MKKYKLIKKYPGSVKLNTVVNFLEGRNIYNFNGSGTFSEISSHLVENNPEFWEKVVEKDYEIIEINGYNGHYILNPVSGLMSFYGKGDGLYNAEYYLNSNFSHHIHSIKRLSDGVVFTVGEIIKDCDYIRNFYIGKAENQKHMMFYNDGHSIKLLDKFLFRTYDGKAIEKISNIKEEHFSEVADYFNITGTDAQGYVTWKGYLEMLVRQNSIYQEDYYYWISSLNGDILSVKACNTQNYKDDMKRFSTIRAAIAFLDKNDIQYDYINCNMPHLIQKFGADCRKISADVYIDDKCIMGLPTWTEIYAKIKKLCEN
jgi:hypothetical protein